MVQPALCAHTVITLGFKPVLVYWFEVKVESDVKKCRQVLQDYSTGTATEKKKVF